MNRLVSSAVYFALWVACWYAIVFTTAPFRIAQFVLNNTGYVMEGFEGSLMSGFGFARFIDRDERKLVEVRGFEMRYAHPLEILSSGVFRVEKLAASSIRFEEIRLEKPLIGTWRGAIESVFPLLREVKFAGGGQMVGLEIAEVEIGEISYRVALGASASDIGPVSLRGLRLRRSRGWDVDKLDVQGRWLRVGWKPSRDAEVRGQLDLSVDIPADVFVDAVKPLRFAQQGHL